MSDPLFDFLLARFAEDEARARELQRRAQDVQLTLQDPNALGRWIPGWHDWPDVEALTARVLAECEAKRRIVELHQSWPVLVEQAPEMDLGHADTVSATVMRVTQRIAWLTQQEYRQRFGDEPPTTPILRALALPYADHPDYREEWKP